MEGGSLILIWNTVPCNRPPPPLPRFHKNPFMGFLFVACEQIKGWKAHLCKCRWKIRLTILHPSVVDSQYTCCPACKFPKSLDSPLTSYRGAGCFAKQDTTPLQTAYATKPLAFTCYMYPAETFFCQVSNCLRAGIHVVLRRVKWQCVGCLISFHLHQT